ncbi:hypothetical protein GQ43DRAFT_372076 [Delitschia confertaspora ATCC 74209]|uniref:C2H2-type domain-containing protein n=1 Tax=Delitschia confertaspora ATCC 74209 TaxID=1513339 RepID=A0A9P4JKP8_9PLEO|nr:hypothetical protein GQ43DRAFT_372076 [Delitschia confertaspora ATCC 74209]
MDAATVTEHTPPRKKEKRFQCQHCQRLFARLEHLQRHERIHSGVKPFSCAECNYSFTRSDLLVRHERLTHRKEEQKSHQTSGDIYTSSESRPVKRMRHSFDSMSHSMDLSSVLSTPAASMTVELPNPSAQQPVHSGPLMTVTQNDDYSLATLSMAAEYQALQSTITNGSISHHENTPAIPATYNRSEQGVAEQIGPSVPSLPHPPSLGESLDNLASFIDNEPLSCYQFSSLINQEQPMPFFSPESFEYPHEFIQQQEKPVTPTSAYGHHVDEPNSISRFGSRLPSLQPEEPKDQPPGKHSIAEVSPVNRQKIADKLNEFSGVVPSNFKLPSRLAFSRYIAAYINGFHDHMPFLHIPTMSIDTCSIELILAMAAVGAQYTFEGEKVVDLFSASRAIANHRIRRRDARLVALHRHAESEPATPHDADRLSSSRSPFRPSSTAGPLGLPSESEISIMGEDLMQTAQALLLLMALCTWAKHREILREALAIQSVLATLIRDDGLQNEAVQGEIPWVDWVRRESVKRTKFIVFGFSNLHCIVYNIPPFILTSEVKLTLPCRSAEFKASTAVAWKEARKRSVPEIQFHDALQRLFSRNGRNVTEWNSSSGNYALIHALIQHIFLVRQVARGRFDGPRELSPEEVCNLENALRNWQTGWKNNTESSLDPMSPNGPVAFNSTALLRLAYIRLYVDTAGRALETRDPTLIANAFRDGPPVQRSPKITRAVLHSVHALSIPIKIGYKLVARTQTFIWSIQHSLCTLECAYLLSKWLEALASPDHATPVTEDEHRIISIVKNMLDETEFALSDAPTDCPTYMRQLSAGVLRVWATIFKGAQTWEIVDVIGSALHIYADMLETV